MVRAASIRAALTLDDSCVCHSKDGVTSSFGGTLSLPCCIATASESDETEVAFRNRVHFGPKMSFHPPVLNSTLCPQLGFYSQEEWLDLLFVCVLQPREPREASRVSAGCLKGACCHLGEDKRRWLHNVHREFQQELEGMFASFSRTWIWKTLTGY